MKINNLVLSAAGFLMLGVTGAACNTSTSAVNGNKAIANAVNAAANVNVNSPVAANTVVVSNAAANSAETKTAASDPSAIVKELYAAHKAGKGPFFQTKDRAIVDKYFSKDLADLIWKDSVEAKGEVGAIDFDPLYGLQDPQVKDLVIMDTGWGGDDKFGADDKAVVQVTYKAEGKENMVSYQFRQEKDKSWKIYDIRYPDQSMLKNILSGAYQGKK